MAWPSVCAGAPDTAHGGVRRLPAGVNEGGTTQALLRPLGRERLFFLCGKPRESCMPRCTRCCPDVTRI